MSSNDALAAYGWAPEYATEEHRGPEFVRTGYDVGDALHANGAPTLTPSGHLNGSGAHARALGTASFGATKARSFVERAVPGRAGRRARNADRLATYDKDPRTGRLRGRDAGAGQATLWWILRRHGYWLAFVAVAAFIVTDAIARM